MTLLWHDHTSGQPFKGRPLTTPPGKTTNARNIDLLRIYRFGNERPFQSRAGRQVKQVGNYLFRAVLQKTRGVWYSRSW